MGDPGGIGPEVTLKALLQKRALPKAEYILFGSRKVIDSEIKGLKAEKDNILFSVQEPDSSFKLHVKGRPCKENGKASFSWFKAGVKAVESGKIQALVTAPISKHSWSLGGIKWSGHTDYLNHTYPEAIMSFFSDKLKVALFSHHLPLKEAIEKIEQKALEDFFLLLNRILNRSSAIKYHFLVAGLNPHAGEEGLLGTEEIEKIIPAVKYCQSKGMPISGPFPPDIVCRKALNEPQKIVIALYHDQGLIAFKLGAFDEGVNVTLGLPFIRTSPDHGTAFNIAGRGLAVPKSMIEAIKMAVKLNAEKILPS